MPSPTPDVTATPADPADTSGRAGGLRPGASPGTLAADRARAGRSQTLADLKAGRLDATPAANAKPASKKLTDDDGGDDDGGGSEMPLRGRTEREIGEREPAATEERKPAERKPEVDDPETSRRLAKITDAEKRSRDKLAVERAELDKADKQLEEKWAAPIKQAQEFSALRAQASKAKTNPALFAKLMNSLGIEEEHFETAAQALYSMSKAGQADPARKQHIERIMRDRELIDRDTEAEDRIAKLEKRVEAREREAEYGQLRTQYVADIGDAISDDFPIASAALAKTRAPANATADERKAAAALRRKLDDRLWAASNALHKESGGGAAPDPRDVLEYFEKTRAAELDELGIARPTRDTKPNGKPADKQRPATTLSSDLSTARVPRQESGGSRAHRAETRRMIESGNHQE